MTREKVVKLIEYITVMPDENADNNRGHRFPFVASEILSCDSPAILDMFFKEHIEYGFLPPEDSEKPVLLTLKFKNEFLQSRRAKKQNEDSGMVADSNEEVVVTDENIQSEIMHNEEETKQGTESTLGSNNAEV